MKLIDGKKIAAKKLLALRTEVNRLGVEPAVAVILVGDDPASHLYVKLKEKAAKEVGIELRRYLFDTHVSKEDIETLIAFLNNDRETHGIIVQLPLPAQLDTDMIVSLIDPMKDVDGFHKDNREKFLQGNEYIYPVFPGAIMHLIENAGKKIEGKKAVVIGKSDIFDRVMTHALTNAGIDASFVMCADSFDDDEMRTILGADIVITACGRPHLFSGEVFKKNAIIIDGGISKIDGKTVGDVDLKRCDDKCDIIIAPVPGGVGPVTIACLLENVVKAMERQNT